MNTSKLEQKKSILEILADDLFPALDRREKYARQDYRVVGESSEQATDWKTGEPKFTEDGDPIYVNEWDYVDKTPEEITDRDRAVLSAVEVIRNTLEKLI